MDLGLVEALKLICTTNGKTLADLIKPLPLGGDQWKWPYEVCINKYCTCLEMMRNTTKPAARRLLAIVRILAQEVS